MKVLTDRELLADVELAYLFEIEGDLGPAKFGELVDRKEQLEPHCHTHPARLWDAAKKIVLTKSFRAGRVTDAANIGIRLDKLRYEERV